MNSKTTTATLIPRAYLACESMDLQSLFELNFSPFILKFPEHTHTHTQTLQEMLGLFEPQPTLSTCQEPVHKLYIEL